MRTFLVLFRLLLIGTFFVLSSLVHPSLAQWVTNGVAVSTASGGQVSPAIVSDGSGGAIITWGDFRSGTSTDIYAQRINASGVVQWTANGVAISTASGGQGSPTIVVDGSGGAIIAWQDTRSGTSTDIYAQRVNASGVVQWTANGVAVSTASSEQKFPRIISDGSGGAIIAWEDWRSGTNSDIYAQRIDVNGVVQWTANGVAISTASGSQYYPFIVSDGSGGAIITWQDRRNGTDWDIYAQRINASGVVQWTANGVTISTASDEQWNPRIVSDGSGDAIITWVDYRNGTANPATIYAQRINAGGVVQWTANGVVIPTASSDPVSPAIVSDGSGGAIITLCDYLSGTSTDIYAQRINGNGAIQWTADGVAISTASGVQQGPTIVSDGSGGAIVTWEDWRSGTNSDIYAQRVNTNGVVQWTANGVAISTAGGHQELPAIVNDGSGGAIITWQDMRGGTSHDIYAQKVASSIVVTKPISGERWIAGEQDTIRWAGRQLGTFVAVDYSTDSGRTYTNIISASLLDSLIWSIPTNLLTTRAKIRVRTVATPLDTALSDTFKIKGDVLTRIRPNGHYESFSSRKHGWSYLNGTLWPATWWNQFQYATGMEPNTGAPYPVFFQSIAPSSFVDWPLWVDVFSTGSCFFSTAFPGSYNGTAQTKWANILHVHNGSCEGFAISSFLAFSYPNQFFTRHNIPNVDSLFSLALNDTIRKTINRYFTYQYGKPAMDNDVPGQAKDPRTTLQEIRNMFRGDSVDISPVFIYNLGPAGGAHTMAPISITVDGSGPSRYRVNLYDSNNPGLDTPYVLVDSLNNTWTDFTGLGWGPSSTHFYLGIPVSNHLVTPAMGRPAAGHTPRGLSNIQYYNNSSADVLYTASNGNRIGFGSGGLIDEVQDGIAIFTKNGRPSRPIGYYIPDDSYSVTLTRVRDSSGGAHITVFRDDVVYAYERANIDSMLTDKLHFGDGLSASSSDASQKQVSLTVIARLDSSERIFFIRNTQLRQNDSLFTREVSQSNLILKNYGTAKTYHLEINERSAQEQEVFVHPSLALPANSTHTIVPNWPDLDGSPIEILVDLGNNGTIDDTLIVNNTLGVDDRGDLGIPQEYTLSQNFPNPFNPITRIEYALPHASYVKLEVYNVLGQHVATLVDDHRPAGRYSVEWNGTSASGSVLGSGTYFYTLVARPSVVGEAFRRTWKMLLLK